MEHGSKKIQRTYKKFKLQGKGNYVCMHVHETHNIAMQGFSKANGN